jgi:diguanylate cyclase (GGDEF)-like protein/PAS domain S-box-containing protein
VLEIREIAERNQAGEALKESQQNLAITLNSIGDAVIATDTDGRVARMNPAAERLTGWALADALGQPLTEVFRIISAHTRLPALNPVQLVMERGEVVGLANHTALQARDGHEYQIADSAAPIRNAAGATVGVVLVFSDVTEKYQAQEALHFTRFSVEAASESIFWITPDARIVDVNAAACRALGYTREELLQLGVSDVDTHYNAEVWPQHFAELRQCGSLTFESQQRTKEGRLFSVEVAANYVKHGNDERNCAFVRDITERKRAEQGLRLSEQRYRFSLEVTGQIGWSCLPDGQVEDAPMWRQYSGQSLEEAVGWKWLDAIHPEDRESANEAVSIAVAQQCDYSTEYRLRRADGVYRNFMVRGVLLFNDDGSPKEWVGTCIDITERTQAEGKLQLAASVFSHAREGITITNAQGIIIDVNEAFTRITGYSREEAIGQNPRILSSGRQDQCFYATMWNALTEQGHWSGEIWNRRKNGEVFAEMLTISSVMDAQGNTQQYVALFSDITAIKAHQSQLEHIAHFDALTNLPNRVLLADRLEQAMAQAQRRGQQLAVTYLDLDGFKAINDQHGHETGDQVLIALATRMKQAQREVDTLARIGGDEFVAVLIDLDDVADSLPMLTRLLGAAAESVQVGHLSLKVSASLGVTFYPQANDIDADQLLRQADQAMYQAKVAGKNRYHVFDADHDSSLRVHHESLERIRLALQNREFVLHYQPKVNMHTGQVIGAEALIRWQHPERGLLAPGTFLPVIEEHPLAVEVGEWVIDTALTQIEVWRAAGLDLPISVNIGARQLQQANFMQRLQAILAKHPQVNPASLELEVLETSALADMEQVSQVIEDCLQMGVKFALDDFGTGYSSLTYLKRLRVAILKIDQSFVRDMLEDPDDLAILEGIIGLAAAFKRDVIAEGVETVAHGTALLHLGCELAQGYGIARPMAADQLPAWVASWQPEGEWHAVPR